MIRSLTLLLFVTVSLFADISILESKPGKITLIMSIDSLEVSELNNTFTLYNAELPHSVHRAGGPILPAAQILLTASQQSTIKVSVNNGTKAVLNLDQPLDKTGGGPVLASNKQYLISRSVTKRVPLNTVYFTPIKSISANSVTYYKEMTITLTYDIGVSPLPVPAGDFYQVLQQLVVNPQDIPYTLLPKIRRSRAMSSQTISYGVPALYFSIHDSVTTNSSAETELFQKNRLYRIQPNDVASLATGAIRFDDLRLQAATRHIFSKAPSTVANLPEVLVDIPVIIHDNNDDSIFNGTDEILFYGAKLPLWELDTLQGTNSWDFRFNFFEAHRYYWITLEGGLTTIPSISLPSSGVDTVLTGLQLDRQKQSNAQTRAIYSYIEHADRRWVWRTFDTKTNTTELTDPITTTGIDSASGALIRLNVHHRGDILETGGLSKTSIAGVIETLGKKDFNTTWYNFDIGSQDEVSLQVDSLFNSYLDFDSYDLQFRQKLSLTGRTFFSFYSDTLPSANVSYDTTVVDFEEVVTATRNYITRSYTIDSLPTEKRYLFRVNPFYETISLVDSLETDSSFTFSDTLGKGYMYHLATESSILAIPSPQTYRHTTITDNQYQIVDPFSTSANNIVDYLIIAPQDLISNAIVLAQHKKEMGQFEHPKVVALEDIFRQFGGGLREPVAIRNMLTYSEEWPDHNGDGIPEYLVMFGDGHYDYKGITTSTQNLIPPYLEPINNEYIVCAVDQNFWGTLYGNSIPSTISGRIPVNSTLESATYISKLIEAEDTLNQDLSSWRNRALLASDDDLKIENGSLVSKGEYSHTQDSDAMGKMILEVNTATDLHNLPLFEYPIANQVSKPQAKNAFISKINEGVGFVNYYGHGSPTLIADENLFASSDIPLLSNNNRYFIFSAFSCTVGLFDFAFKKGMCESLLLEANKGAVATVASTRTAYVSTNKDLGSKFGDYLFRLQDTVIDGVTGDTSYVPAAYSVGQALSIAKGDISESANALKTTYAQLGDPAYHLLRNHSAIALGMHKIDGGPALGDSAGIDTLQRLETIYISGKIQNALPNDTHMVRLELQNPQRTDVKRKDGFTDTFTYRLPGTTTTTKEFPVVGDSFSVPLFIPPNVIDTVSGSQIRAYAWQDGKSKTAAGIVDTGFLFFGYDYSGIDSTDKTGPAISLHKLSTDADGGIIDSVTAPIIENTIEIDGFDPKTKATYFDIHLADPSGVDYFGSEPGEGVRISIEGILPPTRIDENDVVLVDDNYRTVRVRLQLDEANVPAAGEYPMTISARDILQNESVEKYTLNITSTKDEQYTIGNLFCYPSPVRMGQSTQFYFNVPNSGVQDITLKIFTIQGKLVKNIRNIIPGHTWNLKDERGTQLTPNVYLYRLYVKRTKRDNDSFSNSGQSSTEIIRSPIKKIMIHPRN